MGKVIMVFPKTSFDTADNVDIPLGVIAACTLVAQEHECRILDQRIVKDWEGWLEREMRHDTPVCVGISSMTGPQIGHALQVARKVRELNPEVPLIWGGVHATLMPEQTLRHPLVDYVAVGDAEHAFQAFVTARAKGEPVNHIPGIGWREPDGTPKCNGMAPFPNLDNLPEMPLELVNVESYVRVQAFSNTRGLGDRTLGYITSRGCPFRCAYCATPVLSLRKLRTTQPESIVGRLMDIVEKYRLSRVIFNDEEFFAQAKRAERIGDLINGAIKWTVQTRTSDMLRVDMKRMETDGLIGVQPGVETGSARIRILIKKDETVEQVIAANRKIAPTGIVAAYNMMMGFPTETWEDLMDSVDLARQLVEENPRAIVTNFNKLVPLPGSAIFAAAVEHGFKAPDNLEDWVKFSRQQLEWTGGEVPDDRLAAVMYTARFLDGWRVRRRMEVALGTRHPLPFLFRAVGPYFRWRWKHHKFDYWLAYQLNKVVVWALTKRARQAEVAAAPEFDAKAGTEAGGIAADA
jgi:radical SAM superfamily enzyme YgiQ (UPF0313 family)